MKNVAALAVVVLALVAIVTLPLHAQIRPAAANAVKVVLTGTNYCVVCALKEQGAQVTCDGDHHHALRVADVRDEKGDLVRGIAGKTVYYLGNAKGDELEGAEALHDKAVKVEGTLYKNEHYVDVTNYEEIKGGIVSTLPPTGQTGPPVQK